MKRKRKSFLTNFRLEKLRSKESNVAGPKCTKVIAIISNFFILIEFSKNPMIIPQNTIVIVYSDVITISKIMETILVYRFSLPYFLRVPIVNKIKVNIVKKKPQLLNERPHISKGRNMKIGKFIIKKAIERIILKTSNFLSEIFPFVSNGLFDESIKFYF